MARRCAAVRHFHRLAGVDPAADPCGHRQDDHEGAAALAWRRTGQEGANIECRGEAPGRLRTGRIIEGSGGIAQPRGDPKPPKPVGSRIFGSWKKPNPAGRALRLEISLKKAYGISD
jgi:hypothetical protein